jgi:choline dehydrogenase-like flavoprotein
MADDGPDVVVVGAGGDGPVLAWRLGSLGLDVLVLEAGPWHGNENWPNPHGEPGGERSDDPADLSGDLLDAQFTGDERDMNAPFTGKLQWRAADRSQRPWPRSVDGTAVVSQVAGVGGTTLHYLGNHPRAYPAAVDDQPHWPIDYADLVPYYRFLEERLPVGPAPTTDKEAVFYHGCREAGYDLLTGKNVSEPGFRPMPNAIRPPAGDVNERDEFAGADGDTLAGAEHQGGPHPRGTSLDERARRSTNVSFVPDALATGHVTVRPNAFVTDVLTDGAGGTTTATGVEFRDTWSGDTERVTADVVVLAAGAIETPRLWHNADLPTGEWVGRGMTTHWFDWVTGIFDPDTLEDAIGARAVDPHVGQNGAARVDVPGTGGLAVNALPPGVTAMSVYSMSRSGYGFENDCAGEPWDSRGRVAGRELKRRMADYRRTLTVIVHTDDRPRRANRVGVDPETTDEHGPVADVSWDPHPDDDARRDDLARRGAEILRAAGARHVHRTDTPPVLLHMQSTMAMGKVTDDACEARDVERLFLADHSALPNGVGSANPTHTGQALALRTAERLAERYFDVAVPSLGGDA